MSQPVRQQVPSLTHAEPSAASSLRDMRGAVTVADQRSLWGRLAGSAACQAKSRRSLLLFAAALLMLAGAALTQAG